MRYFVDLFSGIGGFRIALEKLGLSCVFSSEIDSHARSAYFKSFGDIPAGDIRSIKAKDIPKHDVLCAGFPCQPFSISGKHKGLKDSRGRLFYEIIRIAKYHKPTIILLENVKNILIVNGGEVISIIESQLTKLGYKLYRSTLNASSFGIPQNRERVYFVCIRIDTCLKYMEPKPSCKEKYLSDILDKDENLDLVVNRKDIVIEKNNCGKKLKPIRIGYLNKGGQGERIYSINGHSITLSANGGGVGARTGLYLVDKKVRKLSVNECKRLMCFPDQHVVSGGVQGYKQLGNAIIPRMVELVYKGIA